MSHFISSLDRQLKIMLLLGGFRLPFGEVIVTMINGPQLLAKYTD